MQQEGPPSGSSAPPSTSHSPVLRRRRSRNSLNGTPHSSGQSTPSRLSGDFDVNGGPTPGKQKRLSTELDVGGLFIKEETVEIGSDVEEEEQEVDLEPVGASQYADPADLDPDADGLLVGFAYFPAEVTLPNNVPARPDFVELELTPGEGMRVPDVHFTLY